jgi:hypothetical protein
VSKLKYIWYVDIDGIFDGYGIRATGRTEKEALDALWKVYKEESPRWNGTRTPHHNTLEELDSWHGIRVMKYEIGKSYFGTESEIDQ